MKRSVFVLALAIALTSLPARAHASRPAAAIPGLKTPGTLTFGTNFGYPPMEMYAGGDVTKPTGADVDLGTAIAARLHLKPSYLNVTDFSTMIPGLEARRYDIGLSSINITPDRSKVVSFVKYLNAGQSILVRKGNPLHILTLADLSGRTVAVQKGTTEVDSVTAENKVLVKQHKALIIVKTYDSDTTAVQQVANGRYVAALDDSPVAAYYAEQQPGIFELGGKVFAIDPYGMALRKDETALASAVSNALAALRKDGTYAKILRKYGLQSQSL